MKDFLWKCGFACRAGAAVRKPKLALQKPVGFLCKTAQKRNLMFPFFIYNLSCKVLLSLQECARRRNFMIMLQ
jgi:hypothetical protein